MNACDKSLVSGPSSATGAEERPGTAVCDAIAPGSAEDGDPSVEARLLLRLLKSQGAPPLEFVLWTGERVSTEASEPVARVSISNRATLFGILVDPQVGFGEAYSDGRITIEGDLVRMLEAVYRAAAGNPRQPSTLRRVLDLLHRPRVNSLVGSRDNIHHHYDIGNAFYALWLGNTMAYTCAYYPTRFATLDEAQIAKMNHVCRKLRLNAGESAVEAGCGWGTLALHMARHYGVRVRAFNISHEQIVYARERAKREGLASLVEYVEDDYRNISGRYDAFVSVGMLEHVGLDNYPALGRVAHQCLDSRGRGLIHSIGCNRPGPLNPWIEKHIFPGACPPSLGEMTQIFEPWDLSVLDVENLRLHYAQTLSHWLELYEGARGRVCEMFDERFVRMWRLYLAGSIAAFNTGSLQLFQVIFAPHDNNNVAWTREHLYAS